MRNVVRKKPKTVVFIDGSNMFYLQKKLGWMFDWKKVLLFLKQENTLVKTNYYEAYEDLQLKTPFFDYLKKSKINVVTKKLKFIVEPETGMRSTKGNFDVEITKDIIFSVLEKRPKAERVILFSGDSDFASLVNDIKKKFRLDFIVYAGRGNLSWELRIAADKICYLEDLQSEIFRKKWGLTKGSKGYRIKKSFSRRS